MIKSLIKYLSISYLFLICAMINAENIQISSEDVLKIPLPLSYNGDIYSEVEVNDFIEDAVNNLKQPVIIFGGNWCPDCRILSGTLKTPSIEKFMNNHYRVLHIDVGRYDKNMNLISYFGVAKEEGVPRVLVFDKDKNLLNSSSTKEWTTVRDRKMQDVFDYFQELVK